MEELELMEEVEKFYAEATTFMNKQRDEYSRLKGKEKQIRAENYPFLKRRKKRIQYPRYDDLCRYIGYNGNDSLKQYYIRKIKGIYKHSQAHKTAICNSRILDNIADGVSTLCLAKNTLSANEQWKSRLLEDRDKIYTGDYCPELFVISSSKPEKHKKPEIERRRVTHFISIDAFNTHIASNKSDEPFILFVCSNDIRLRNLLVILDICTNINYKPPFELIWDESHNKKEGIPSKRDISEMIVIHPRIRTFIPCTATNEDFIDEESTLWNKDNLENNAINYTDFNDYKSDSSEYSSLHDAKIMPLEELRNHPLYKNYNVTHFSKELFAKYCDKDKIRKDLKGHTEEEILKAIDLDIEKRRELEYHSFMKDEKKFYNDGLNLVNNIDGSLSIGIHVIHTPKRNAFTESLMEDAVKKPYRPICIGLWGTMFHLMYDDISKSIKLKGVLNEQILKILTEIKEEGREVSTVLILGNYTPTGESMSLYHPAYGHLSSSNILGAYSSTEAYQAYSRTNFAKRGMTQKPEKYLVGELLTIQSALAIEKQNDLRIDRFRLATEMGETDNVIYKRKTVITEDDNISIPVRCEYENDSDNITRMKEICRKDKTTQEERDVLIMLLFDEIRNENINMVDPTGKFKDSFKMKNVRRYNRHPEEDILLRRATKGDKYVSFEETYRFESYSANHRENRAFINNKKNIAIGECEMLCCIDKYILTRGEYKFTNKVSVFWISYRFPHDHKNM